MQPAWDIETTIKDSQEADEELKKDGLNIDDACSDNNLYLPYSKSTLHPRGFSVTFDPSGITTTKDCTLKPVTAMLHPQIYDLSPQAAEKPDIQDAIYGRQEQRPLRLKHQSNGIRRHSV